jgi:hypothetical protein
MKISFVIRRLVGSCAQHFNHQQKTHQQHSFTHYDNTKS